MAPAFRQANLITIKADHTTVSEVRQYLGDLSSMIIDQKPDKDIP